MPNKLVDSIALGERTLRVGDTAFIVSVKYEQDVTPARVISITSGGRVSVVPNSAPNAEPRQFSLRWEKLCEFGPNCRYYLELDAAVIEQRKTRARLARAAAMALNAVGLDRAPRQDWSPDAMMEAWRDLERLMQEARVAIEEYTRALEA